MNNDSEMIADSKVIQLRRGQAERPLRQLQTAEPLTVFSPGFANRLKHAVAQMCRTNVAAVDKPIDNLLVSLAEFENDEDQVDGSELREAFRLAMAAIPDKTGRDCTQIYKYIERLAEPHRSIVKLRLEEGLTYLRIAKRVDIDPRTVLEILSQHWSAMAAIYEAAPAARRK